LERLLQRIAIGLSLEPLDIIRRNLIDANSLSLFTATGALLDSGN
jgi:2-furoyl-CoA dehydrogenase large subunit